eukprot:2343923-Prymnesium_polylepis.1
MGLARFRPPMKGRDVATSTDSNSLRHTHGGQQRSTGRTPRPPLTPPTTTSRCSSRRAASWWCSSRNRNHASRWR